MTKAIYRSTLLMVGLILFLFACDKQENAPSKSAADGNEVRLESGALRFASEQAFESTLTTLQKNQSKLDAWEKKFSGFVSMRTAFNSITDRDIAIITSQGSTKGYDSFLTIIGEGDDKEAVMNVDDDLLATLLNKDGILYIGDALYKVNYRKLVKVSDFKSNKVDLSTLGSVTSSDQSRGITVADVKHRYMGAPGNVKNAREVTCIKDYWHGNALCCKKRFVGQLYTTEVGFLYSSAGAKSVHQRRTSGIWWADKIPEIQVRVQGEFVQHYSGMPSITAPVNYDSGVQIDDSGDKENFQFCVNAPCEFSINWMNSYHYGKCDDYQVRECNLTW
jgi:hypothetical protein